MKAFLLYLLVILGYPLTGSAQIVNPGSFSFIGIREGISNNQVTDIVQDSFGFIWVSTRKGLNRYDGKNTTQFFSDSNRNSLPTDDIHLLKMLPGNQLAACTPSGLFLINCKTLSSKAVFIPPDSLMYEYKVNVVIDVEGDENGNIYIVTRSGFYVVDSRQNITFRYDHYNRGDAQTRTFGFGYSVIRFDKDNYILCTEKGQWIYNSIQKKITSISASKDPFFQAVTQKGYLFRTVYKSSQGFMALSDTPRLVYYNIIDKSVQRLYIPQHEVNHIDYRSVINKLNDTLYTVCGNENGFYFIHYDRQQKKFIFDPAVNFSSFHCRAVMMDREGRLWVATSKGVFKGKNRRSAPEVLTVPSSIFHDSTDINFRLLRLIGDKIYAGAKEGLFVFDRATGKAIKRYDFASFSPTSKNIYTMVNLNADSLLIGPNSSMIVFNPKTSQYTQARLPGWEKKNWIPAIHADNRGNLFIAINELGYIYVRKKGEAFGHPQLFNNNFYKRILLPFKIKQDYENNLWFVGHGVSRYNSNLGDFDMIIDSFPRMKTGRREVQNLVFDKAGNMYLGLADGGLGVYHPATKKKEQFGRSNGLPDNRVDALYLIDKTLWIGTTSGLATFNIDTKEIFSYGNINDERPETYFTGFEFYYDSIHRQMYAPCNNSIIRFDPFAFKSSRSKPSFFIENIRINDRETIYHPGREITLGPGKKNLLVNIASINFEDALQEQFFYRFKGKGEWQAVGSQRSLVLSNLADGDHDLEFMLGSKSNSWKPIIVGLHIYIKPPFYKTSWFIIIAIIGLLSALWLLYRARIQRIRQKANIDNQLAELEMKSLHAQMNPHFIFNALNSIKEMIWENDKQNASRYLSKFAQLIRTTLEQSRQNFITVKQCVLHLEQYLEMEKIRFDDFNYKIETDREMEWEQVKMAPMLVQPLVENAIWHGLKQVPAEKFLIIKFYHDKNHVVCEIEDNGPGIYHQANHMKPNGKHRSISIENIRNRLQMLNEKYNMNCSLEFIDKADINPQTHGTIAILRLSI